MQLFVKKYNTKCDLCLDISKIENKCKICNYSMCKECFDKYIDFGNSNCAQCREELEINLEMDLETERNIKCKCSFQKHKKNLYDFLKNNACIFYIIFTLAFMTSLYFLGYAITKSHKEFNIFNFFLGLMIFLVISIICGMFFNTICMCLYLNR